MLSNQTVLLLILIRSFARYTLQENLASAVVPGFELLSLFFFLKIVGIRIIVISFLRLPGVSLPFCNAFGKDQHNSIVVVLSLEGTEEEEDRSEEPESRLSWLRASLLKSSVPGP